MKSRLLSYRQDNSSGTNKSNYRLLEEDDAVEDEVKSIKMMHKSHNIFNNKIHIESEPNTTI
jgi:hypothetical protein